MSEHDDQEQPTAQLGDSEPLAYWCSTCSRVRGPDEVLIATSFAGADVYLCETCGESCDELP